MPGPRFGWAFEAEGEDWNSRKSAGVGLRCSGGWWLGCWRRGGNSGVLAPRGVARSGFGDWNCSRVFGTKPRKQGMTSSCISLVATTLLKSIEIRSCPIEKCNLSICRKLDTMHLFC